MSALIEKFSYRLREVGKGTEYQEILTQMNAIQDDVEANNRVIRTYLDKIDQLGNYEGAVENG